MRIGWLKKLAAVALALGICTGCTAQAKPVKVSPEQARELIGQGGITVVDVRSQPEFESGRIPGAMRIVHLKMGELAPKLLPDQNARILLYCRTGARSDQTARLMIKMGYTQIYDLAGGITAWDGELEMGPEEGNAQSDGLSEMGPLTGMG